MAHQFTQLVDSRARYYCKGSPVHFVRVELFRMEDTGDTAVTLTFKNLHTRPLMSFTAYFRCKNSAGEVVVEDAFTYDNIQAGEGACFGADDAVFVSREPLAGVEVRLGSVTYDDGMPHDLRRCMAVALPQPQPLPAGVRADVERTLRISGAAYYPEDVEDGWRCTCGAFNYNAGRGLYYCSECGAEKALLKAALRASASTAAGASTYGADMQFLPVRDEQTPARSSRQYIQRNLRGVFPEPKPVQVIPRELYDAPAPSSNSVSIMKDTTADFILRYVPLFTAIASSLFTAAAVLVARYLR